MDPQEVLYVPDVCHQDDADHMGRAVGAGPWRARIVEEHEDGTATLEIQHPLPGVVCEYRRREGGPGVPGTYYRPEQSEG